MAMARSRRKEMSRYRTKVHKNKPLSNSKNNLSDV